MKKPYLVFKIKNCAEDYIAVSKFCDEVAASKGNVNLPLNLVGKVFVYQNEETDITEKLLSMILNDLNGGKLKEYGELHPQISGDIYGFLHISHEEEDATVEYIYLSALMYKYPKFFCFLYVKNVKNINNRYAIFYKASEFFFRFSEQDKMFQNRIYGEMHSNRDQMWQIAKMYKPIDSALNSKVNPILILDENKQDVGFWRKSCKQHMESGKGSTDKFSQIMKRCRMNFTKEFGKRSKKKEQYYKEMYDSKAFQRETENMPLFAFYLFCMQVHYSKNGPEMKPKEIRSILLNVWDIADGILQLMENIHHTTEKIGFLEVRVHENVEGKEYLAKRYGISDKIHNLYYEIRLLDLSGENILESFRRQMGSSESTNQMRVTHFFENKQEDSAKEFWENYNKKEENLVHHYGLQVFSSIISANEGIFKVVSSSKYEYDGTGETYTNRAEWEAGNVGSAHMPGTEYIVLVPFKGQTEKIATSLETNAEYQYEPANNYDVREYCTKSSVSDGYHYEYESQEQKEKLINGLAEQIFCWMKNEVNKLPSGKKFVIFLSMKKCLNVSLEIYCKALMLCGIRWKKHCQKDFYCIINDCAENQVIEISRLFAIFYCKACLPEYLVGMQIYIAGESEEILITGKNLSSLYAITSKIMLVKGINSETANIMNYLLGQYGFGENREAEENGNVELVPFDMLQLPDKRKTFFEKNVITVLETDIQKLSFGCKICDTHMRVGSKIHIASFYEAELLFHNNYYVSRFAELILQKLPIDKAKKIILVGYETYSEMLLYKIVAGIQARAEQEDLEIQVSYMIYEQRTDGNFRYMDEDCLESKFQLQFAIIVPINSTLTTHNKIRDSLGRVLEKKGLSEKSKSQIIANYALILIRSSERDEQDEMEQKYWNKINVNNKVVNTPLISEGEPDVEYFVCVSTKWHNPLTCPICFPVECIKEKPLIETDRTSIVPMQMIGLFEAGVKMPEEPTVDTDNLQRVKALKDVLVYNHVIRNGNHYLYYFCLERYFIQERDNIIAWLKEERKKRKKILNCVVYDIIVSPLHYSNAGFLAEVNHYLFDNAALVLNFEVEKEFRDNVKTKYSNIIGLYRNLLKMKMKALIRFHFVDDTIVSGRTLARAKSVFQALIYSESKDIQVEVFSDIVVMLNRMSESSVATLNGNADFDKEDGGERKFCAYVNLNISSMRNHEDACTECKLVENFTRLRKQSSTNQQYKFWDGKIKQHVPREIQNKQQEEVLSTEERKDRAYRRMLCTHLTNERLSGLGQNRNNTARVKKEMIKLLTDAKEDQIEWIISYIKVFSRPFVNFRKNSREAVFQIMLWMIDYMTNDLMVKRRGVRREYKEIKDVCLAIREYKDQNGFDIVIRNLLIILIKRLSDLGSNYAIRKENMLRILAVLKKMEISEEEKEDFKNCYIAIIKKICCQSSDESKSTFFEYLLICGEEYGKLDGKKEKEVLKGENLKFCSEVKDTFFVWKAFLENTRVLYDGIRELSEDIEKKWTKETEEIEITEILLQEYYYENFKYLLYLYGYWDMQKGEFRAEGKSLLTAMVRLYQYLGKRTQEYAKRDAETYYVELLRIIEQLTGAKRCYLLYGTSEDGVTQYYRFQDKKVEVVKLTDSSLGIENLVADTYVPVFPVEDFGCRLKRTIMKYEISSGREEGSVNMVFFQLDFPEQFTERKIMILLKWLMVFHDMILGQLRQDFSNNMIQKWTAREYFKKHMLLQRAADHTDRDNLLKYYDEISHLDQSNDPDKQMKRNRALFCMVINSYIARMNVQMLAGTNPEREPSRTSFGMVYKEQLKPLIDSMKAIEEPFRIWDEKGEEKFSEDLLDRKVRLRQTEERESLSLRRISIIVAELMLSAINHSGYDVTDIYIYREKDCLVVKNKFKSKKEIALINDNIKDSVERKKDGISLAAIKETVNKCYGLYGEDGVEICAVQEENEKYFFVKLPILQIWED